MTNKSKEEKIVPENEINEVEKYVQDLKAEKNKKTLTQENVAPDFLLPQFKSVEEQAKSYKELQALHTKQAQELAKYKKAEEISALQPKTINSNTKKEIQLREEKLRQLYLAEAENINQALCFGKITEKEARVYFAKLRSFVQNEVNNVVSQYQYLTNKGDVAHNIVSPKEYFLDDLKERNYLTPICEFLETNYKKMSKKELDDVKNLIYQLENSLREEILNEKSLKTSNENYRKGLNSTTNLNNQTFGEKVYTLAELKKMQPEEFRKNQKLILEQFAARKIK